MLLQCCLVRSILCMQAAVDCAQVLCNAICIFMELHERMEQGCNAAFQDFMKVSSVSQQFAMLLAYHSQFIHPHPLHGT